MARYVSDWTARPEAVASFPRFCAPTTLAALVGCTRVEAATALLPIAMKTQTGAVQTSKWVTYLESLGGVSQSIWQEWDSVGRRFFPRPTVAQFLRANPRGTFVFMVRGHTLLGRDGEVVADTMLSKSKRARVFSVVTFTENPTHV